MSIEDTSMVSKDGNTEADEEKTLVVVTRVVEETTLKNKSLFDPSWKVVAV